MLYAAYISLYYILVSYSDVVKNGDQNYENTEF